MYFLRIYCWESENSQSGCQDVDTAKSVHANMCREIVGGNQLGNFLIKVAGKAKGTLGKEGKTATLQFDPKARHGDQRCEVSEKPEPSKPGKMPSRSRSHPKVVHGLVDLAKSSRQLTLQKGGQGRN